MPPQRGVVHRNQGRTKCVHRGHQGHVIINSNHPHACACCPPRQETQLSLSSRHLPLPCPSAVKRLSRGDAGACRPSRTWASYCIGEKRSGPLAACEVFHKASAVLSAGNSLFRAPIFEDGQQSVKFFTKCLFFSTQLFLSKYRVTPIEFTRSMS